VYIIQLPPPGVGERNQKVPEEGKGRKGEGKEKGRGGGKRIKNIELYTPLYQYVQY